MATQPDNPDFGRDLKGVDDIDPYGRETNGTRLAAERIARRFITERGTLVGAPNDGLDLRKELNDSLDTTRGLAQLQSAIAAEAAKEEVADNYLVRVDYTRSTNTMTIEIQAFGGLGPFDLTLNVDAVSVSLLKE